MNETPKYSKRYLKLRFFIFCFGMFAFSYLLVSIERETVGRPNNTWQQILQPDSRDLCQLPRAGFKQGNKFASIYFLTRFPYP